MKKAIFLILLVTLLVINLSFPAFSEEIKISAPSAILMELEAGKVIWEKNSNVKRPMASTTKIMTALIALETLPVDKVVKVSKKATEIGEAEIYLTEGETITVENLLYGLLLRSGNDAAVALAEASAGSEKNFVKRMNTRAAEIGALNTHFANSHGLDGSSHYTTAYDLALITREALKNNIFRQIVSTREKNIPWPGEPYPRHLENHNKLLFKRSDVKGVKTGYTSKAGHCLVSLSQKGNIELLAVVLGAPTSEDCYRDTELLLDYGLSHVIRKRVAKKGEPVAKIFLADAQKSFEAICEKDVLIVYNKNEPPVVDVQVDTSVKFPLKRGERVGKLVVRVGNEKLAEADILSSENVKGKSFLRKATSFYKSVWGFLINLVKSILS
jgi:D-alanyl-D-alanine carboxypeptidase (penicillin-binding protein 5/6)